MDLRGDSETLPTLATVGGAVLDQQLSNARCQTESGGSVLLRLLEFKTHLLEVVEELHIRRDAETRFEDQISKLVLEKQELEWEKESQQHQIETAANQHTESLINVKKRLQAKIRNIEEEKGKYQVSAELKDKEINILKEELKSLQLLKFNLEKKSSELEQKLSLQSRSKDSHLNQLGEAERRFSALSRQCAMVKQAHEKLQQNVDEAIKINKKLTAADKKQEATIALLKKELEEVSNKLIKVKMSSIRQDKVLSPSGREQHCQQLQHKLNMETEMNQKLREENVSVRAEKQEVMRSLQNTQQLLLSQTQTVSRIELELQTQREQNQALKQEHRVMRERSSAMEDKVVQLMESFAASKNSWDKEKEKLLCCIEMKQQNLQVVKEAYDELHQEHSQLSSQMRDSSQSRGVSTEIPALIEEIRGEETLDELVSSSDLQPLTSSQTNNPDCLEDSKIMSTGATGVSSISSPGCRSNNGTVDLQSKEKSDEGNGGMSDKDHGRKNDVITIREEGQRNEELQWNKEVQDEEMQEEENRGMAQTTDATDRPERSTEDSGDPKQPGTETKDRAEGRKTGHHSAETQIPAQSTTDTTTQQVVDFMDSEPPPAGCEPPDCEEDADSRHVDQGHEMRTEEYTFCSYEHQSVSGERVVQHFGSDEENVEKITEENPSAATELSGPLNQSDICVLQTNPPLAAQTDVSIQELETTQANNPSDSSSHMKQTDDECVEPPTLSPSQNISEQTGQLKSLKTDDGSDSSAYKKREDTCAIDVCETAQEPPEKLNVKDACADITTDTVDLELEDTGDAKMTKTDLKIHPSHESVSTKHYQQSPSTETLPEDTNDLLKTYKSSFDWISAQRKTTSSRAKSDVSILHQFAQGSSLFEQKTSGPGGLRHPPSTMFLNRTHNKVPVVISRASDLSNASSVSGTAASTMRPTTDVTSYRQPDRHRMNELWRNIYLMTPGTAERLFQSQLAVCPGKPPQGKSIYYLQQRQEVRRCSRAPPSAAGPSSESDWESSFSQETEDQQSSFRAQISKIEQFLSSERLRLPKRRKTDN